MQVVYRGIAAEATDFFAARGFPCPIGYNPPDFIMDLFVLGQIPSNTIESIQDELIQPSSEFSVLFLSCRSQKSVLTDHFIQL
jgi:hypothetical protein